MQSLYIDIAGRLGRTALQVLGTYLATRGILTDAAAWEVISGAIMTIGTTLYTVYAAGKASSKS
jgi:hypothetical protein